jgi:hypothetical protein
VRHWARTRRLSEAAEQRKRAQDSTSSADTHLVLLGVADRQARHGPLEAHRHSVRRLLLVSRLLLAARRLVVLEEAQRLIAAVLQPRLGRVDAAHDRARLAVVHVSMPLFWYARSSSPSISPWIALARREVCGLTARLARTWFLLCEQNRPACLCPHECTDCPYLPCAVCCPAAAPSAGLTFGSDARHMGASSSRLSESSCSCSSVFLSRSTRTVRCGSECQRASASGRLGDAR